jgi:Asp-tRNA(Asn)/Glu-tRNA(Gln) amidotransferase A subunit family amidase
MHGIPISVKDSIYQKGKLSTFGLAYLCDELALTDSVLLKLFLVEGAIPIVKGNTSQGPFGMHSTNNVFGEAVNPFDFLRTCGGSSGGDAGLVASKCVPFSISDDTCGGIIVPAAFCGVYGFKPTTGRITNRGIGCARDNRFDEFNHVPSVPGPIGTSVNDLVIGF